MRKKIYQMNTCRRKYYIETETNKFGPFKDQINAHKRRYYTGTENNTLRSHNKLYLERTVEI